MLSGDQPFAVLLYNFTDDQNPEPFTHVQVLEAWRVTTQYWSDVSLGIVNVGNSTVFDWQSTGMKNADFIAKFTPPTGGEPNRCGIINYIKTLSGIDQSKYTGFLIIFSLSVGTSFDCGSGSIFDQNSSYTTYFCHEMQHIFGETEHSFDYSGRTNLGMPGEYYDQTDIMSAGNCYSTQGEPGNPLTQAGPFLCNVWRDYWGWLDQGYLRRIADRDLSEPFDQTFTLAARDFPSGQGSLGLQLGDIYVELAFNDNALSFDAGLPSSGILIRRKVPGRANGADVIRPHILVKDLANAPDQKFWFAGDVAAPITGQPAAVVYIWVRSIDAPSRTAQVNISNEPFKPLTALHVVARRMLRSSAGGGDGFDYIEWLGVALDSQTGSVLAMPRDKVVDWINQGRNTFFVVGKDGSRADVVVVDGYIVKTQADGDKADNLLTLPLF